MSNTGKWFRVRVTDLKTGKSKTDFKFPAGLANFGMKMAARYASESVQGLDMNELIEVMKNSGEGMLVDVEDKEKGEHVEIFLE